MPTSLRCCTFIACTTSLLIWLGCEQQDVTYTAKNSPHTHPHTAAFPGVSHVVSFDLYGVSGNDNAKARIDIHSDDPERVESYDTETPGVLALVWDTTHFTASNVSRFQSPVQMASALASLPKNTLLVLVSKGDIKAFAESETLFSLLEEFGMPPSFKTLSSTQSFVFSGRKFQGTRNALFSASSVSHNIDTHHILVDGVWLGGSSQTPANPPLQAGPGVRIANNTIGLDLTSETPSLRIQNGVISMPVSGSNQQLGTQDIVGFAAVVAPNITSDFIHTQDIHMKEEGLIQWDNSETLIAVDRIHTPSVESETGVFETLTSAHVGASSLVSTRGEVGGTTFDNGNVQARHMVSASSLSIGNTFQVASPFIHNGIQDASAVFERGVYVGSARSNAVSLPHGGELVAEKSLHVGSAYQSGAISLGRAFDNNETDQDLVNGPVRIATSLEGGLEIHAHLAEGVGVYTASNVRFHLHTLNNGVATYPLLASMSNKGFTHPIAYNNPGQVAFDNMANGLTGLTAWYNNAENTLQWTVKTPQGQILHTQSVLSDFSSPRTVVTDIVDTHVLNVASNGSISFTDGDTWIDSTTLATETLTSTDSYTENHHTSGNMVVGNNRNGSWIALAPALGNSALSTAPSLTEYYIATDNGVTSGHANSLVVFSGGTNGMVFETPTGGFHFSSQIKLHNALSNRIANSVSYASTSVLKNNFFIQPLPASDSASNTMATGTDINNGHIGSMMAWLNDNAVQPSLNIHVKQYNGVSHYASIPLYPQQIQSPGAYATTLANNTTLNGVYPTYVLVNGASGQTLTLPEAYSVRGKIFVVQKINNGLANVVTPDGDYFVGRTSNTVSQLNGIGATQQFTAIGNQQWLLIHLE